MDNFGPLVHFKKKKVGGRTYIGFMKVRAPHIFFLLRTKLLSISKSPGTENVFKKNTRVIGLFSFISLRNSAIRYSGKVTVAENNITCIISVIIYIFDV